jgi:predicted hydrolase (HD superfamily)
MIRQNAYTLLTKYLHNKNLTKHCLATEATMKAIYKHVTPSSQQTEEDEQKWGITGLLHDADYELAQQKPEKHGLLLFEKEKNTFPPDIAHAIQSHNYQHTKVLPQSSMDWAITTCDQLTGLIVAAALVHPEKKLAPLTDDFIINRFNEKSFARGANRTTIALCQDKLGIPLKEFIHLTLQAMKAIHNELEL